MKAKELFKKLWIMLKSNWGIKLISLLLAFIIWSYVMAGTNPLRTKTVDDVKVTITNASELKAKNLIIVESELQMPETVSAVVEAGIDIHKNISAETLKATVNLAEINEAGEATLKITCASQSAGVTVKSIYPSEITFKVDDLVSKWVPVVTELQGNARDDYYVGEPTLKSDYVEISGAKSTVSRISRAVCYIDIENLTENVKASYPIALFDYDGNIIIDNLIVDKYPSAIVDIKVLPKKTVAIDEQSVIDAVTNVKEGYEVTGVVIQPASIQIAAEQSVLDKIETIRVQSINVDGADKSIMVDAELQPLENVEYQSATMVEVLVQISEIQDERTFRNRKISLENVEDGLKATIDTEKYTDVTVRGGKSIVGRLSADDLMPYVDLAGLGRGTHICMVEIPQIDGISVEDVTLSVSNVTVTIK